MKTIILAGGFGTRLQSVVKDIPKPMADIAGTPFLALLMDNMLRYGTDEFILCVSYLKEKIMGFFGNSYRGCSIRYSVEEEPLGTGGAIKQAFDRFGIDRAIVINGDSFVQMNYAQFYIENKTQMLSIALKRVPNASRFGQVETEGRYITRFHEKSSQAQEGLINAGIYIVHKDLWKYAPRTPKFSFEKDVLEKHIAELRVPFFMADEYFIDIGVPESYQQACRELKSIIYESQK